MNNREIIYQSLDIMEENLKSSLTIFEVSERLGFSVYYFSRLFKGITGVSPKNYMLKRKISRSAEDVQNTEKKLMDIALDYGFGSSESYSRAFCKIIGMNPSDLRKNGAEIGFKLFPRITKGKIERRAFTENQEPELIEFGPLHLVGLPFYYDTCRVNDLSKPWSQLTRNIAFIKSRVRPEKYYQMQYWFPDQDTDSMFFFIALEVESLDEIPVQFTAKTLPRMHYLKFFHKGLSGQVGRTYQFIYDKWLPETSYKLPHFFNFEYYGDRHLGPYNEESVSEIYIPVKV
jgi:AraC family transcriptional regulator